MQLPGWFKYETKEIGNVLITWMVEYEEFIFFIGATYINGLFLNLFYRGMLKFRSQKISRLTKDFVIVRMDDNHYSVSNFNFVNLIEAFAYDVNLSSITQTQMSFLFSMAIAFRTDFASNSHNS